MSADDLEQALGPLRRCSFCEALPTVEVTCDCEKPPVLCGPCMKEHVEILHREVVR